MSSYKRFFFVILFALIFLFLLGCKNSNQLNCDDYDDAYRDICTFNYAAKVAEQNVTKAMEVCNNLKEEISVSRCLWGVADRIIQNIVVVSQQHNINLSMGVCGNISDQKWSGECFYNLAQGIVFKYPAKAFEICEYSQKYWSFPCYQHLFSKFEEIFPEPKEMYYLCQSFRNKFLKRDCYKSLGAITGYRYNEGIDKAYEICQNIEEEHKKNCFAGFSASLGWFYPETYYEDNLNKVLDKCDNLPYPDICYRHFINSFFTRFETNITKSIGLCKQTKNTYKDDCFLILINKLRRPINGKIFNFSSCNKFDKKYKGACYSALSYAIGRTITNVDHAKEVCTRLENEYKYDCFEGFGANNVIHYLFYLPSHFIKKANDCKQLNSEFIFNCFRSFSKPMLWDIYEYNINMSSSICYLFEEDYRKSCFQGIGSAFNLKNDVPDDSVCSYVCNEIDKKYEKDCFFGCWNELSNFVPSFLKEHCTTLENKAYREECFEIWNKTTIQLE
jgi:hypothetical protein